MKISVHKIKTVIMLLLALLVLGIILSFYWKTKSVATNKIELSETKEVLRVDNGRFVIKISKQTGMIDSLKLKDDYFELNADLGKYNLFYPEFCIEKQDASPEDTYTPANSGKVVVTKTYIDTRRVVVVKVIWKTGLIDSIWYYVIPKNKTYFITRIQRVVKEANVYSNFQQCTMVNPDMDDSYIVNYEGKWIKTMDNGTPLFSTLCIEHSMFTALNLGKSIRYPAFGWYDRESNTSIGMITTYVSPNQRMTISYHGGGSSGKHPGYGEGQWNWFGKADAESMFLKKGTSLEMEIIYVLGKGNPDKIIDDFNKNLLNPNCFAEKRAENVISGSWGGRRSSTQPDNFRYNWNFPEASSNFITTQQLFDYRGVSLPQSQNGSLRSSIFDLSVKMEDEKGEVIDLTPIGPRIKPKEMRREETKDSEKGTVVWKIKNVENSLSYQLFINSDKLIVEGNVKISPEVSSKIKNLYVEILGTERVQEIYPVSDGIYDIRINDPVLGKQGILVYKMDNIRRIERQANTMRIFLAVNKKEVSYKFILWPHREWIFQNYQISPFYSLPQLTYRDYCRPPELKFYERFY